jgi:hypothetical protein
LKLQTLTFPRTPSPRTLSSNVLASRQHGGVNALRCPPSARDRFNSSRWTGPSGTPSSATARPSSPSFWFAGIPPHTRGPRQRRRRSILSPGGCSSRTSTRRRRSWRHDGRPTIGRPVRRHPSLRHNPWHRLAYWAAMSSHHHIAPGSLSRVVVTVTSLWLGQAPTLSLGHGRAHVTHGCPFFCPHCGGGRRRGDPYRRSPRSRCPPTFARSGNGRLPRIAVPDTRRRLARLDS